MALWYILFFDDLTGTTSDENGRRMCRSGGAGSDIPKGLSSRRAVPYRPYSKVLNDGVLGMYYRLMVML